MPRSGTLFASRLFEPGQAARVRPAARLGRAVERGETTEQDDSDQKQVAHFQSPHLATEAEDRSFATSIVKYSLPRILHSVTSL